MHSTQSAPLPTRFKRIFKCNGMFLESDVFRWQPGFHFKALLLSFLFNSLKTVGKNTRKMHDQPMNDLTEPKYGNFQNFGGLLPTKKGLFGQQTRSISLTQPEKTVLAKSLFFFIFKSADFNMKSARLVT